MSQYSHILKYIYIIYTYGIYLKPRFETTLFLCNFFTPYMNLNEVVTL